MHTFFLAFALVLTLATAHAAPPAAEIAPTRLSERLARDLALDAPTSAQVAAILAEGRARGGEIRVAIGDQAGVLRRALEGGDPQATARALERLQQLQGALRAQQEATRAEAQRLLTPEQRARWALLRLGRGTPQGGAPIPEADPQPLAIPFAAP